MTPMAVTCGAFRRLVPWIATLVAACGGAPSSPDAMVTADAPGSVDGHAVDAAGPGYTATELQTVLFPFGATSSASIGPTVAGRTSSGSRRWRLARGRRWC
jgi:hypothetical protein